MAFTLIQHKVGEPAMYLGSSADVSGSDSDINAALPGVPVGTLICTAGYGAIKQLDTDGETWVTFGGGGGE